MWSSARLGGQTEPPAARAERKRAAQRSAAALAAEAHKKNKKYEPRTPKQSRVASY